MELKTNRLTIERVHQQNVAALSPLLNYQSLFRQAGLVAIGDVNLLSLRLIAQTECLLLLREQEQGTVIGLMVLLHSYDETGQMIARQFEVGYLLLPQAQRQGYMTEALNAVCDRLSRLQIKVIAKTRKSNSRSIGVLRRCKFMPIILNSSEEIELWQR